VSPGVQHNTDLVLSVGQRVDRALWDESRYDEFIDALCRGREYQREAMLVCLRYLLGGQYECLRDLARENFDRSESLQARYGSWGGFQNELQFPDKLAASIDLATGSGKSYVMYGIATILLAEGVVDSVLVLCPSLTIEAGLTEKFRTLSQDQNLFSLLPEDAAVTIPSIVDGSQTVTSGCICVENYHAVLQGTGSSLRDSFRGRGQRVLVLNDEAHHVANAGGTETRKWKEYLLDPDFDFRFIIGLSGTCYVGNDYFSDVIYRYSLRQAIEERYAKRVHYVEQLADIRGTDEKWQLCLQVHEQSRRTAERFGIRPMTIVVTNTIARCKAVAEELRHFLVENGHCSAEDVDSRVLAVYHGAPDSLRLPTLDDASSPTEWVVSVSMLNEGWDVKRVFTIVPHEERAFDSKLLISQVLGRGLRVPESMAAEGQQPTVTVLNHDAWAPRIRHLVDDVLDNSQRLSSCVSPQSPFHFDLHTIVYDMEQSESETVFRGEADFLAKGYVDFAADLPERTVRGELVDAVNGRHSELSVVISQRTYDPSAVAQEMWDRLVDIDETNTADEDPTSYAANNSVSQLEAVILESMRRVAADSLTDRMRQRLLASLGVLSRGVSRTVRWTPIETTTRVLSTADRQADSVSASELRASKVIFYTDDTATTVSDRQRAFFEEVVEEGSPYRAVHVQNVNDLRTPLNLVIADSDNERRFITELKRPENAAALESWIKSVAVRFYDIDYTWRKGQHQRRGKFSPDFFIKLSELVVVAEVKDDQEISEPSPENVKKNEYAKRHFERVNRRLEEAGSPQRYKFTFVTPRDFQTLFQMMRDGRVMDFRSDLDVKLDEELRRSSEEGG